MVQLESVLWSGVLLLGVVAAHWGAEKLAAPLKKLRQQWGLTAVAGGAFVGLAAASPEISINAVSAIRGVSDIGLGVMLGSNILAIPLIVTVAYFASRTRTLDNPDSQNAPSRQSQSTQENSAHEQHREHHLLRVKREAVWVLAIPYLGILAVVALLTLPAGWRGLQPIDSWIMGSAYVVFLGQAIVRGRQESESVEWNAKEIGLAVAGILVLAAGAYAAVRATENLVATFGISKLIGGLFITGIVAAAPEIFATWSVIRSGQVTAGTTSVIGDNAVTMSIAFFPLGLVTVPIRDFQLFWVNLAFVALMPATYALFLHWGAPEHGFKRWQVGLFDGLYLLYVAIMVFWVLNLL